MQKPKRIKKRGVGRLQPLASCTGFWDGFLASQQPGFTITLPSESDDDIDIGVLLADEYKPLWGIQAAFLAVGKPNVGAWGEDIKVSPELSWITYKKEMEKENGDVYIR
jgi:hypothetical protein